MPRWYAGSNSAFHFMDYNFVCRRKYTWDIVENSDLNVLEELSIKGIVMNRCHARNLGDARRNRIARYATHRAKSAGRFTVPTDLKHKLQECSECRSIKHDLKLSEPTYQCEICELTIEGGLNAVKNIERNGMEWLKGIMYVSEGISEFTCLEIQGQTGRATPIVETGNPYL